eukprot:Nk52_evm30s554 gene=Nk52_evmTU30s554
MPVAGTRKSLRSTRWVARKQTKEEEDTSERQKKVTDPIRKVRKNQLAKTTGERKSLRQANISKRRGVDLKKEILEEANKENQAGKKLGRREKLILWREEKKTAASKKETQDRKPFVAAGKVNSTGGMRLSITSKNTILDTKAPKVVSKKSFNTRSKKTPSDKNSVPKQIEPEEEDKENINDDKIEEIVPEEHSNVEEAGCAMEMDPQKEDFKGADEEDRAENSTELKREDSGKMLIEKEKSSVSENPCPNDSDSECKERKESSDSPSKTGENSEKCDDGSDQSAEDTDKEQITEAYSAKEDGNSVAPGDKFKNVMEEAKSKLQSLCDKWTAILENEHPSEDISGQIRSAIGQAHLLISKRFKQYGELCEMSKDKTAKLETRSSDLEGFWDVIQFQVDDVFARFASIETLRNNDWKESTAEESKAPKKVAEKRSRKVTGKKSSSASRESARQRLMDAKKAAAKNKGDSSEMTVEIYAPDKENPSTSNTNNTALNNTINTPLKKIPASIPRSLGKATSLKLGLPCTPGRIRTGPRPVLEGNEECEEKFSTFKTHAPSVAPTNATEQGPVVAVLTPKKASKKERAELGSDFVLTPVRRSTRHLGGKNASAKKDSEISSLLDSTGYAYAPNEALEASNIPSTYGVEAPKSASRKRFNYAAGCKSEPKATESVTEGDEDGEEVSKLPSLDEALGLDHSSDECTPISSSMPSGEASVKVDNLAIVVEKTKIDPKGSAASSSPKGTMRKIAAVTPSKKVREFLGADVILSPVRRSARSHRTKQACGDKVNEVLHENEDFAFLPNEALKR